MSQAGQHFNKPPTKVAKWRFAVANQPASTQMASRSGNCNAESMFNKVFDGMRQPRTRQKQAWLGHHFALRGACADELVSAP